MRQLSRVATWVGAAGAAAGLLYLVFRPVKPKSNPLVLPSTTRDFGRTLLAAVNAVAPSLSLRAKLMVVAHAAYESGWGKAKAYREANNPFNLTAAAGPSIPGPDTECDAAGRCRAITQRWAVFSDVAAGTAGYLAFIRRPRYADAYARLAAGDVSFLDVLYRGGFFTLPLSTYKENYLSVLSRVQREAGGAA